MYNVNCLLFRMIVIASDIVLLSVFQVHGHRAFSAGRQPQPPARMGHTLIRLPW